MQKFSRLEEAKKSKKTAGENQRPVSDLQPIKPLPAIQTGVELITPFGEQVINGDCLWVDYWTE